MPLQPAMESFGAIVVLMTLCPRMSAIHKHLHARSLSLRHIDSPSPSFLVSDFPRGIQKDYKIYLNEACMATGDFTFVINIFN